MRLSQRHSALSRRAFLKYILGAGAGLAASCVPGPPATDTPATQLPATSLPPSPVPPTGTIAALPATAATDTFLPLASSAPTATPSPTATPAPSDRIKSIIFFIQENHTLDS